MIDVGNELENENERNITVTQYDTILVDGNIRTMNTQEPLLATNTAIQNDSSQPPPPLAPYQLTINDMTNT